MNALAECEAAEEDPGYNISSSSSNGSQYSIPQGTMVSVRWEGSRVVPR